jgi:hypothetical protein
VTGNTFRLATFTSSLWYAETGDTGETPTCVQEVVEVPSAYAVQFWKSIDELNPLAIESEVMSGLDGMSVLGSYAEAEKSASFETWSPSPTSLTGKFLNLIYGLGCVVLKEKVSIERLEQLHGYLRLPANRQQ